MKIGVYHNVSRDASFGLNTVFTAKGKATRVRSHQLVPVFEFDTPRMTPGQVYRALNVGDDTEFSVPDTEGWRIAAAYRERRLRSLSVGDVLRFEDGDKVTFQECGRFGWDPVRRTALDIITDPAEAERIVRNRYDFRPGEPLSVTVPLG